MTITEKLFKISTKTDIWMKQGNDEKRTSRRPKTIKNEKKEAISLLTDFAKNTDRDN